MYPAIKEYYDLGIYTEADLDLFVNVDFITPEQKTEIMSDK